MINMLMHLLLNINFNGLLIVIISYYPRVFEMTESLSTVFKHAIILNLGEFVVCYGLTTFEGLISTVIRRGYLVYTKQKLFKLSIKITQFIAVYQTKII